MRETAQQSQPHIQPTQQESPTKDKGLYADVATKSSPRSPSYGLQQVSYTVSLQHRHTVTHSLVATTSSWVHRQGRTHSLTHNCTSGPGHTCNCMGKCSHNIKLYM